MATWSGLGDGSTWSDPANWSGGVPGAQDTAVIPGGTNAPQINVTASTTVCDVQVGAQASLTAASGTMFSATDMKVTGGVPNSATFLLGDITSTDFEVAAGVTDYGAIDAGPDSVTVDGTFTLDPGATFQLSDNTTELDVTGTAKLGGAGAASNLIGNSSCDCDDSPPFNIDGTVTVAGIVRSSDLDLQPTATSQLARGHTWALTGDSFARFPSGVALTSSPAGGTITVGAAYHLLLSGTTTIGSGATLSLKGGTISDPNWFHTSSTSGELAGPGTLQWLSGQVVGHLTLDAGLITSLSGSGSRHLSDPNVEKTTLLVNHSTLTVSGGSLTVDDSHDTFENFGRLSVVGGSVGENASDAPPYLNEPGGTWTVAPTSGTASRMPAGSLTNLGTLVVAPKVHLTIGDRFQQRSGATVQLTISSTSSHSTISANSLALGGTLHLVSAAGFAPSPPVTVPKLLVGQRSGTFGNVTSTTVGKNTKWTAVYHAASVDGQLVST